MSKRFWAALGAGALLAGGVVVAAPATAVEPYSISKTNTGPASIVAGSGQQAEFTVTVDLIDFAAPLEGTEVGGFTTTFTDQLPFGLVLAEVPDGCQGNAGTNYLSCEVDFGQSSSVSVVVKAVAEASARPGTYTNCAYLAFGAPEVDGEPSQATCTPPAAPTGQLASYSASASVEVTNDADLVLTASQPGQVNPGASTQITWNVKNDGPSAADSPLTLTSTLPEGVTFVSGSDPWQCSASGQDVTCTYMPMYTVPPVTSACAPQLETEQVCDFGPVVFPGDEIPPLVWDVTTASPGKVAQYDVLGTVASGTSDSKPDNNAATSVINVTPVDLTVSKTARSRAMVGDEVTWTLDVSNAGSIDDAGTVTVTDTLPRNVRFVAAEATGWECMAQGRTLTCTRAGLAKGASSQIVVRTNMTAGGLAKNTAKISSQSYDGNSANNSSSKTVRVVRLPQSAAALPAVPTRVKAGRTQQGQRLTTRVRCRPARAVAAGEVSYCSVTRADGVVRVKVLGASPVRVTVLQTARGTAKYRPFLQRKTYLVRP